MSGRPGEAVCRFWGVAREHHPLARWIHILMAVAGLAWVFACLWYPLTDTDIWWHLAAGKLMASTGTIPRTDPFSQSSLGAPWIDLHWGFQWISWRLWNLDGNLGWNLGGARALVAGKCLAVAGALALAFQPHWNRRTAPWLIVLAAFGIYQVRFFLDVRPLALTLLGLGMQYAAVTAHLRGRMAQPWWILVPVQAAMVNIQGLYLLGPFLVSCLLAGEYAGRRLPAVFARQGGEGDGGSTVALRPLLFTTAALWLSGLASPFGIAGFLLPFSLLGRIAPVAGNIFSSEIAENLPLGGLLRSDPGAALPFLFLALAFALTFSGAKPAAGVPGPRVPLGHVLLFAGFSVLGWMAQRNLPLFVLAGLMAAGRNLQVSMAGDAPIRSRFRRTAPALLAAVVLIYGPKIRAAWDYELPGSLETPFRFPAPAVDYLEAHPVPGNLFNELRFGGYLEFRLFPSRLAFVDGRMILRDAEFYRDFLEAADHPERFPAYRARYGFTHALLPIAEDQRFLPLAAWLLREGGWRLLYCDGASVLLADGAPQTSPSFPSDPGLQGLGLDSVPAGHPIAQALRRRFDANPRLRSIAILNAAGFLRAAGKERAAADLLGP
jgi:hypothetical protein